MSKRETGAEAAVNPWRRIRAGWYVTAIEPGQLYVHIKRAENPRFGWDVMRSDSEHEFDRADGFLHGGWRTGADARDMAQETIDKWAVQR